MAHRPASLLTAAAAALTLTLGAGIPSAAIAAPGPVAEHTSDASRPQLAPGEAGPVESRDAGATDELSELDLTEAHGETKAPPTPGPEAPESGVGPSAAEPSAAEPSVSEAPAAAKLPHPQHTPITQGVYPAPGKPIGVIGSSKISWEFDPAEHPRPFPEAEHSWGGPGEYHGDIAWSLFWVRNYTSRPTVIDRVQTSIVGGYGTVGLSNCKLPITIPAGGSYACEFSYRFTARDKEDIDLTLLWTGPHGVELDDMRWIKHEIPPVVTPPSTAGPFTDVSKRHKFVTPITWMKTSGLSTGHADGSYRPQAQLTREAMAAFMYRLAGKPAFTMPQRGFTDVRPGHKFYREIMWMRASGLSKGHADGTYRPAAPLSREAMAAFMYRMPGKPAGTRPPRGFTDVRPGHKFYREIMWMRSSGITTGNADGSFRPRAPVTREAMAAFVYRFAGSPA